jgi:hypothetical protein
LTSLYNDLENPKGTKVEGREGKRERIRERERKSLFQSTGSILQPCHLPASGLRDTTATSEL